MARAKQGETQGAAKQGNKQGGGRRSAGPGPAKTATEDTSRARRNAQGGLAKPVRASEDLAKIVGTGQMTRAEVTKKVWDYVKSKDLQDDQDRRMINADERLRPVFGGKQQVSMFEMTKLVNEHLQPA